MTLPVLTRLRRWAVRIKRDALTLWFAYRDPATPWPAKALCWFVVAYALSPIDLIPDFIPVLGLLDDALLLPGLIWLALRMLPDAVLAQSRLRAQALLQEGVGKPRSRAGCWLVAGTWFVMLALAGYLIWLR